MDEAGPITVPGLGNDRYQVLYNNYSQSVAAMHVVVLLTMDLGPDRTVRAEYSSQELPISPRVRNPSAGKAQRS